MRPGDDMSLKCKLLTLLVVILLGWAATLVATMYKDFKADYYQRRIKQLERIRGETNC